MKNFENLIFLFIATFIIISCSNSVNNNTNNNFQSGEPIITFDTLFYDFGSIKQGEKVTHSYEYTNTGTSDLVITDVIPSCGCTVPKYDKNPLPPGKSGTINVVFNTHGRNGSQYKSVKINSNALNKSVTLTFKANIIQSKN